MIKESKKLHKERDKKDYQEIINKYSTKIIQLAAKLTTQSDFFIFLKTKNYVKLCKRLRETNPTLTKQKDYGTKTKRKRNPRIRGYNRSSEQQTRGE